MLDSPQPPAKPTPRSNASPKALALENEGVAQETPIRVVEVRWRTCRA